MGSGVILLVIVAMWAVVLVPTLLRRHDSISETRSIDRFSAAMRILSRRTPEVPGSREIVMPARPASAREPLVSPAGAAGAAAPAWRVTRVVTDARVPRPAPPAADEAPRREAPRRPAPARGEARVAPRPARGRPSLAVRRRRLLLVLAVLTFVLLPVALLGGGVWWGAETCSAVLLAGYVVHLRAETRRARQIARRRAAAHRPARPSALRQGWATAPRAWGDEDVEHRAGGPAETVFDVASPDAAGAQPQQDESWDPVDVPLPTYVTKPPAPQQLFDQEAPGSWTDTLHDDAAEGDDTGERDELAEIMERRRAVGG